MNEQEIFERLKEALDYKYLFDSWSMNDKEVDNLEDYLRLIKQERALEKDLEDSEINRLNTYQEFIDYLADKAIGNRLFYLKRNSYEYIFRKRHISNARRIYIRF